jgi:hypothetical protein
MMVLASTMPVPICPTAASISSSITSICSPSSVRPPPACRMVSALYGAA